MNTLLLFCIVLIGVAYAQEAEHKDHEEYIDYHAPAHYRFDYAVHDPKTHDFKRQWESREGDKVEGEYHLEQPDGRTRTVKYRADKETGFQADVEYKGKAYHHYQYHGHDGGHKAEGGAGGA